MGNWRTVNITGTIPADEVEALRRHLTADYDDMTTDGWKHFGPLTIVRTMVGLNDWVAEQVDACGNLAERDFTVGQVADHLRDLLDFAPSMNLQVHCGGENESTECVATVVAADGQVSVEAPRIISVTAPDDFSVFTQLFGGRS